MTVQSWTKSLQSDNEIAVEAIRVAVSAYRKGGDKTLKALVKLAQHVNDVSGRRIRGLFFREDIQKCVGAVERHTIRMGVARAIRAQAKHLEMRACELRDIANQIEREEAEWGQSTSSVKRVA